MRKSKEKEDFMKSYISAALIFAALLVTVPAAPLFASEISSRHRQPDEKQVNASVVSEKSTEPESAKTKKESSESYKALDITTGKIEDISAFDYIVGAVCAEMPATFEKEALKAQAVAAHTYAERQKEKLKRRRIQSLEAPIFPTTALNIRHILQKIK
ncbi:secreted protein containing Sporulation stage II protein D, amidase enhancer LytB [human gut metagenome]|uniref:Secreted protein containing Sporulation stage II protein D, amidase enhancer LytB n=1 Tax=human gut metagenome TaxID=408170 RepID=K1T6U9_9ZZZZ